MSETHKESRDNMVKHDDVNHDAGVVDGRGRRVGFRLMIVEKYVWFQGEGHSGRPMGPEFSGYTGTIFDVRIQTTRDGEEFGSFQGFTAFKHYEDAVDYGNAKIADRIKQARKKFDAPDEPETAAVEPEFALINLTTTFDRNKADRLKAILDGQTYFKLNVTVCPNPGGFEVNVETLDLNGHTVDSFRDMVMMVLTDELLKRI